MTSPQIKYGILRTRDLVELYFGARMVAALKETFFPAITPSSIIPIMDQDPRRVAYEINLSNFNEGFAIVFVGSPTAMGQQQGQTYFIPAGETVQIARNFFTDLDAVAIPQSLLSESSLDVSVRETFLTPLPADELP
jgi:hypothetical protein